MNRQIFQLGSSLRSLAKPPAGTTSNSDQDAQSFSQPGPASIEAVELLMLHCVSAEVFLRVTQSCWLSSISLSSSPTKLFWRHFFIWLSLNNSASVLFCWLLCPFCSHHPELLTCLPHLKLARLFLEETLHTSFTNLLEKMMSYFVRCIPSLPRSYWPFKRVTLL